jgi:hypothetical protein
MLLYKERLWASPWLYISTVLVIPAVLIVFAPINFIVGIVLSIAIYGGCVVFFAASAPSIRVTDTMLYAGRAQIPLTFVGEPESFSGHEAFLERGQRLDARAWLLLRGGKEWVVKVPILDALDPVPYWLLSSRTPARLIRAISKAKARAAESAG